VVKDGQKVDELSVNNSASGRHSAAKLLANHLADPDKPEADTAIARLLAWAVQELDRAASQAGTPIADLLRDRVPKALQLVYRTDRGGLWSESLGKELMRSEFVTYSPTWLVEAANDVAGGVSRLGLLRIIASELGVIWCDMQAQLPLATGAALGHDTAAGRKFWEAMIRLWTVTQIFESRRSECESVTSKESLVSRVRSAGGLRRRADSSARSRWVPVHEAFDAWWRPAVLESGECVTLLAMRWALMGQVKVELPGVTDQASLTALGRKFGVIADPPAGLPDRLSGGVGRLAVLSLGMTNELFAQPDEAVASCGSDTPAGAQ
jgi:hypothetical protein